MVFRCALKSKEEELEIEFDRGVRVSGFPPAFLYCRMTSVPCVSFFVPAELAELSACVCIELFA